MHYTLKQMQVFSNVAKTLNITTSAHELHMTPPGVHKHICNLEDICQVKLFKTVNKRLSLTQHGQQLQENIQPLLQEASALKEQLISLNTLTSKKISISITNTFAKLFYNLIRQYSTTHPFIEFKIEAPTWSDQHIHLSKSSHQLYIFGEPKILKKDYNVLTLFNFKMVLVAPFNKMNNSLLKNPKQIINSQFIFPCAEGKSRDFQLQLFKKWQVKKAPHYFEGYAAILDAVRAQIGIAFLPDIIVENDLQNKTLFKIPIKFQSPDIPVVVAWKKEVGLTEQSQNFLTFLQESFS